MKINFDEAAKGAPGDLEFYPKIARGALPLNVPEDRVNAGSQVEGFLGKFTGYAGRIQSLPSAGSCGQNGLPPPVSPSTLGLGLPWPGKTRMGATISVGEGQGRPSTKSPHR